MAKAKSSGFALGDVLAGVLPVSNPDTVEQIVYLDITLLDEDANNFYSTDGIEELAANIELIGLQQPLRVRANPDMPGRYLIVSGHRRRLAVWILYEENPDKWRKVPCIIEVNVGSPALQELRLIYANADTRKMSSWDISRQAERVEALLYQLKEEGFEFPGRMRDHVAEACKVSKTKLAVLTAIRNNLIPELHKFYEDGSLNESAAYELQKLPKEGQKAIADSCQRSHSASFITANASAWCVEYAKRYMTPCKCGDSDECDHHAQRFVQTVRAQYSYQRCDGQCCLSCSELDHCKAPCKKGKAKQKADKEKSAAKAEKTKAQQAREEAKQQAKYRRSLQQEAQRLLPLIEKAGLDESTTLPGRYGYLRNTVPEIRKYADGDFGDKHFYDGSMIPQYLSELRQWADMLGCSLDYLTGRSEDPQPIASAEPSASCQAPAAAVYNNPWKRKPIKLPVGSPILTYHSTNEGDVYRAAIWDGSRYVDTKTKHKELTGLQVLRWMEIPADEATVQPTVQGLPLQFQSGNPDHDCVCWCVFSIGGGTHVQAARWLEEKWRFYKINEVIDSECVGWIELPDYEGVLRK